MNVYEIMNPSDPCTVTSESDLTAWLAVTIVLSSGAYGLTRVRDDKRFPILLFGGEERLSGALKNAFGEERDLSVVLAEHQEGMAACLESFVYGNAGERTLYEETLGLISTEEKRNVYRVKHQELQRSSMTDIGAACTALAAALRKQIAEEAARACR